MLLVGTWFATPVDMNMQHDAHQSQQSARDHDIIAGAKTIIIIGPDVFGVVETFDDVCNLMDARRLS